MVDYILTRIPAGGWAGGRGAAVWCCSWTRCLQRGWQRCARARAPISSRTGVRPAGRIGVPDDLVGPALFLSSPASDYVTGAEIAVDGGGAALPMLSAQDPEAYKP